MKRSLNSKIIKRKTKTETKRAKRPTERALSVPLAGCPAFVSVWPFALHFGFPFLGFLIFLVYDNSTKSKSN